MAFCSTWEHKWLFWIRWCKPAVLRRWNTSPFVDDEIQSLKNALQLLLVDIGHPILDYQLKTLNEFVTGRWIVRPLRERIASQHPSEGYNNGMECPFDHWTREWRHTRGFYESVNTLVICSKVFVVGTISRTGWVVNCHHRAGFLSSNAT